MAQVDASKLRGSPLTYVLVALLAVAFVSTCMPRAETLPPCVASTRFDRISPPASVVTIAAVGDVADCSGGGKQMEVAALVDKLAPDAVFALGDLAYPDGTIDEFLDCYGPSLGRFREITRPVVGNHEYHTPHAGGYFAYFCGTSGTPFQGWYSFDIGRWHVVALNSVCGSDLDVPSDVAGDFGGCGRSSPQIAWLRADLEAHRGQCTLAMWHHPRWSSSTEGSSHAVDTIWRTVTEYGVDVVLNGHAHDYQRFPALDADGARDDAHGTRMFVVGTGGSAFSGFDSDHPRSEVTDDSSHGVLRLALRDDSYAWSFVPIDGDGFHDEGGEIPCHP
ncbi:MAG: putative purple acid phosphatase-like protein [Labilithrix sp.]|nr:putative purple acid phosphatase-like protein [Labilithrix sp.]